MSKQRVQTPLAPGPTAGAPYSQAVIAGHLVFVAGQLPLDPSTGRLVEGDVSAQTEQVMTNLRHVLEAAGATMNDLVKVTVYLRSRKDWAAMNEVYAMHVGDIPPARVAAVVGEIGFGASVEIEAIAHL